MNWALNVPGVGPDVFGVTAFDCAEGALVPFTLVAFTVNV
jgi:hypothetical protein